MARKADEKFEMTSEELERLHEAMKKEEFRKLLVEYAEEISNPENRKKYEEEIAMLESERGVDVKFIHPHPGYVLRTCADGSRKAFINVAQNDTIERASLDRASGGGARGVHWNIPHSFAPPREDRDKSGTKCSVFDVVFHPDTLRMALSNAAFKRAIDSTALEGIERQFGVQLDRSNVKTMKKLKFKGKPTATVIRKTKENCPPAATERDLNDPLGRLPYPYGAPSSGGGGDGTPLTPPREQQPQDRKQSSEPNKSKAAASGGDEDDGYAVPKHTIVNRYHADMTDFATNLSSPAAGNSRPRALVVEVSLPLLSSAAGVTLDVLDRKLSLKSDTPARYKLDLTLPYPVDDLAGSAKFDKRKKCLVVTLPVVPAAKPQAAVESSLPMSPSPASCCNGTGVTDEISNDRDPAQIDPSGTTVDVAQGNESSQQQWPAGNARHAVGEAAISDARGSTRAEPAAVCSGGSGNNDFNMADACSTVSSSQEDGKRAAEAGTGTSAAVPVDRTSSHDKSSSCDASLLPAALPDEGVSVGSGGSSSRDGCAGVNAPDAPAIKYMMPQFSYDQDDLRVTFVIEVKNIKADSVHVAFGVDRQAADVAVAPERAGSDSAAVCCSGGSSFVATFCSIGSGYFPMHYSLAVRFPAGCQIESDDCAVDVSVRNAVLIFRKASTASGSWQSFQCARTVEELASDAGEMKDFATLENLQAELNRLEKECTEAKQLDTCPSAAATSSTATSAGAGATAAARSLFVKSLRDECLSINIKELDSIRPEPATTRSAAAASTAVSAASRCRRQHRDDDEIEDDEDDSALSSPEIIYNKEPPKDLQGILKKQRGDSSSSSSSSGSSCPSDGPDEAALGGASSSDGGLTRSVSGGTGGVSSDGGIESPDSSDDNGSSALTQRKKAVTFNDHVDETAYQPSAAVTMLHQTLKNKRKRQKKKEDRKQHAATVAEGRRRRRNSSSGSMTTDEEEVVAAAVSEVATTAGSHASVGSAVRQRSSQHARSPRITDTAVSSLAAYAATPQTVAISEGNIGDGACGINADGTAILDFDVATSPVDRSCRAAEIAADLSKPAADLSKPAADLSKPAADLSKPAADLSKPAADLSKPAAATNDPVIGGSADVDRVEIRERGTAVHNGTAGEGEAGSEIAPDHRGTSGVPQLAHHSPSSIGGGRLPSQTPNEDSGERRCSSAAADSDDDERDGTADAFATSSASSGSPALASVGCRAAVSHNEHATKCSFAFRNSIAYELD